MKNKKLFAILTLVCFMFTLMPVAAFAADPVYSLDIQATANGGQKLVVLKDGVPSADKKDVYRFDVDGKVVAGPFNGTEFAWTADVVAGLAVGTGFGLTADKATVFITAEMVRVANGALNTAADAETSVFEAVDGSQTVKLDKASTTGVAFDLVLHDKYETDAADTDLYVWATTANGTRTSAISVNGNNPDANNIVKVANVNSDDTFTVTFARTGEYTVYAALAGTYKVESGDVKDLLVFDQGEFSVITVKTSAADPDTYTATLEFNDTTAANNDIALTGKVAANGEFTPAVVITPNNVMSDKIFVNFYAADGTALKGETVSIETNSSAIEVSKASDVTNSQGQIDFKVAGSIEGEYEVILSVDGVEWTVKVVVGNTAATYIETVTQPTAPQALYEKFDTDVIEFSITDINGNVVGANADGMDGIVANDETGKYIVLTEAPADSDLESEDLKLTWNGTDKVWYLDGVGTMDAEGTYAVKVILDNGAYATAKWEVKKFQKPVQLVIGSSTDVIELGAAVNGELLYYDVNGVEKAATDVELAVTGYAVASAVQNPNGSNTDNHNFKITVKDDEKYVGAVVTATAVSEKYDLVATKDFKVADGAVEIAFVDKSADVNVNNKLEWNVVNSEGTRVALANVVANSVDIKYVVLDKPADAKVSVNNVDTGNDLLNKGIGKMSLTSNKVGNVTVQVVMKAKYETTNNEVANQVKYYTGTQIFAVGTEGVGDVVVMSIGSNEIVINDAKATIDAAPVVENNRTFVPFRALAEAFGATVAYDEATQAVTAELNGTTVVMTIGSATYTVNGVEKTADVAPFINGSRTMVPVRFAAEAFGIKVIPTYDENGATADILFNL